MKVLKWHWNKNKTARWQYDSFRSCYIKEWNDTYYEWWVDDYVDGGGYNVVWQCEVVKAIDGRFREEWYWDYAWDY